jgi:hypothetical protein
VILGYVAYIQFDCTTDALIVNQKKYNKSKTNKKILGKELCKNTIFLARAGQQQGHSLPVAVQCLPDNEDLHGTHL